jgi:hypothetical protein
MKFNKKITKRICAIFLAGILAVNGNIPFHSIETLTASPDNDLTLW